MKRDKLIEELIKLTKNPEYHLRSVGGKHVFVKGLTPLSRPLNNTEMIIFLSGFLEGVKLKES